MNINDILLHRVLPILLLTLIFGYCSYSQEISIVKGTIRERNNSLTIAGAQIRIQNSKIGTHSDSKGYYSLKNVPFGKHMLIIKCIGYKTLSQEISVDKNEIVLHINLESLPYSTDEVVVSASKRVQAVQDVPISISVIDQRAIADRSITKIDDALRYVSGVNVAKDQVSIRGSSGFALGLGSRTAILLDGFPLLSGDNADIKFDMMPMMDIERIEVIKGAGSALYGTGALGGVISMFTSSPKEHSQIKVRGFSGGYDKPTYPAWEVFPTTPLLYGIDASYSQRMGSFSTTISGGYKYDRSYKLWDDSKRWNVYGKFGYDFSEQTSCFLFINTASEERGNFLFWNDLDSATKPPTTSNLNERRLSKKFITGAELKHLIGDDAFFLIRSSAFTTSFDELYKAQGDEIVASDAMSWFTESQLSTSLSEKNFLTVGGVFTVNSVDSPTYGERSQSIASGYTQIENTSFTDLIVTVGGRIDIEKTESIEQQHIQFSPKLGLSYSGFSPLRLRSSFGQGFRTPAVAERFANIRNPFPVNANPKLVPERSTTFEIGANSEFTIFEIPLSWDFSIYQTEFKDLVEPQIILNGAVPAITFNNVLSARIQGTELTLKSMFGSIGFETSITAMYARNTVLNTPLKFRSPILWYNRIWIPISEFEVQVDYRFIARSERILDDNELIFEQYIPDVQKRVPTHVLDLRAIWNLQKKEILPLKIIVNAKNLLNYYYVEVIGNLAPIRQFSLQCELNL